jgi:hypothetical protein
MDKKHGFFFLIIDANHCENNKSWKSKKLGYYKWRFYVMAKV